MIGPLSDDELLDYDESITSTLPEKASKAISKKFISDISEQTSISVEVPDNLSTEEDLLSP